MSEFDYISAVQNQIAQNNAWSAEQAQKQMDFQREMSNTAHVREIADLKAAGLNPVLSAKLGGASTPSGASASADPAGTSAMVSLLTKMLDIQSDNAKANLVNAERGSSYSNSGSIPSESSASWSGTDVSGVLGAFGIPVNSATGEALASFTNGVNGVDNGKNKAYKAYEIGQKVGTFVNTVKSSVGNIIRDYKNEVGTNSINFAKKIGSTISNVVKKVFPATQKPSRQPTK